MSSFQNKVEVTVGQLYLWKDASHQRQVTLDHQLKIVANLKTKLLIAKSDFFTAVEELDEPKERDWSLLEQLKINQFNVATLNRELKVHDMVTKMGDVFSLYKHRMLPMDAPTDSITGRFPELSLLCHPGQRGTQEAFFQPQRVTEFLLMQTSALSINSTDAKLQTTFLASKTMYSKELCSGSDVSRALIFSMANVLFLFSCFTAMRLIWFLGGNVIGYLKEDWQKFSGRR